MKNTDLIAVGEREFKVGDLVVMVDASDYATVFQIIGRPLRMYQLKGVDDLFYGRLGFQIRHATPAEIKAGHRINDAVTELSGNAGEFDHVTDIAYHVSPLTKVQCHHQWISGDVLGDTEHQYFCTYCGEKKTEAFGVKHESN